MKVLLLLSMMVILASCSANDSSLVKGKPGPQKNIIALVKINDVEGVKRALDKGTDVNTRDKKGKNLLLVAVSGRQVEMARLLVERGADVNMQDNIQDSPFLLAGATGQTALVKLFIANGARFDIYNRYNGTALTPAAERGHLETVRVLVGAKDYPLDHVNRLGWTALMEAIVLGDGTKKYQEIVQILKNGGANINISDHNGITPLQHAKKRGFTQIANILTH